MHANAFTRSVRVETFFSTDVHHAPGTSYKEVAGAARSQLLTSSQRSCHVQFSAGRGDLGTPPDQSSVPVKRVSPHPGCTGRYRSALRRFAAVLCALLCLASTGALAQQAERTELLCIMRQGEPTATLHVAAGTDPLAPSSVKVGDRYEMRAVALGEAGGAARVSHVVVTVLNLEGAGHSIVLSQSRSATACHGVLDQDAARRPTLWAWEPVYSHKLGRELAWACALVQKGLAPEGWARAEATDGTVPSCQRRRASSR